MSGPSSAEFCTGGPGSEGWAWAWGARASAHTRARVVRENNDEESNGMQMLLNSKDSRSGPRPKQAMRVWTRTRRDNSRMPELPEVEVTRQSFAERIAGARVTAVRLGKPLRWPLGCTPESLVGQTVGETTR